MSSAVKANLRAPQPTIKYAAAAAAGISNAPAAGPVPPPPQTPSVATPSTPASSTTTTNGPSTASPPPLSTDAAATANTSSPSLTQPSLSTSSPLISTIASPPVAEINNIPARATPPQPLTDSLSNSPALSDPVPQPPPSPKRAASGLGEPIDSRVWPSGTKPISYSFVGRLAFGFHTVDGTFYYVLLTFLFVRELTTFTSLRKYSRFPMAPSCPSPCPFSKLFSQSFSSRCPRHLGSVHSHQCSPRLA